MFETIDPLTLITSGAIVVFLVQQAKRWVPSDFLPLAALALGVALQLVNDIALSTEPVTAASVWLTIVTGAGVGMAAGGTYDLAGRVAASESTPRRALPADDDPVVG